MILKTVSIVWHRLWERFVVSLKEKFVIVNTRCNNIEDGQYSNPETTIAALNELIA